MSSSLRLRLATALSSAVLALGCSGGARPLPEPVAHAPEPPRALVAMEPAPVASAVPPATATNDDPTCEPLTIDVPSLDDSRMAVSEVPLVDPTGGGMRAFHERLARLIRGKAKDHVRIGVYGDSNMVMDFITGPLRRDLQARWGDGGHGFIALARPWSHYRHIDVVQKVGSALEQYAVTTKPIPDGMYGYAGIFSESASPGASVHVGTAPDSSPVGRAASVFDVYYLKGPKQGTFDVLVDGKKAASIDSHATSPGPGIYRVEVPDGPHGFDVSVTLPPDKKPRYVRLLGSDLERTAPSVIVDQLGVGAMGTRCITLEKPEIAEPLIQYRRYDLVILMTGTADIYQLDQSVGFVKYVVDLHRKANPNVSFLAVAPPDRGESLSLPALLTLGQQRSQLASDIGIGYWDLLAAMGGPRSMLKFVDSQMGLPDQIHFSEVGGAWVGHRLERALLADFQRYLASHPRAGCDDAGMPENQPWDAGPHEL